MENGLKSFKFYNGNPNLLKAGSKHEWTPEMVAELDKCSKDPVYFARAHFKIVHPDHGLIPFDLYDFQEEAIIASLAHRNVILNTSRQVGKCQSLNTVIKVRNKRNGIEESITSRDFLRRRLVEEGIISDKDIKTDEEIIEIAKINFGTKR